MFCRVAGLAAASSGVESGLGRGQDIFHKRRRSLNELHQYDEIVLELDGPKELEELCFSSHDESADAIVLQPTELITSAQRIWSQHLPFVRGAYQQRIDSGRKRPERTGLPGTIHRMVLNRRAGARQAIDVADAAGEICEGDVVMGSISAEDPSLSARQVQLAQQAERNIHKKRRVLDDLQAQAAPKPKAKPKPKARARPVRVRTSQRVFFASSEDKCPLPAGYTLVQEAMLKQGLNDILVVPMSLVSANLPTDPYPGNSMCALLFLARVFGWRLVSPGWFNDKQLASIKYQPALRRRCVVFLTPHFQERYLGTTTLFRELAAKPTCKWSLHLSVAKLKAASAKAPKSTYCISGLSRSREDDTISFNEFMDRLKAVSVVGTHDGLRRRGVQSNN